MNALSTAESRWATGGKPPPDAPPALIAVPVPKAVLLLTEAEDIRAIKRGKWWKRTHAAGKREADAVTPETP